jgi:hypothetical protein
MVEGTAFMLVASEWFVFRSGTGGVLLKHAHGPSSDERINLRIQRLPAGTYPRIPDYVARHLKNPLDQVLTNSDFANQF